MAATCPSAPTTSTSAPESGAAVRLRCGVDRGRPLVVLMGDSVLDNSCWLSNPKDNLLPQLRDMLAATHDVVTLAVDEMTTFNFLDRDPKLHPWASYQEIRRKTLDEIKEPVVAGYPPYIYSDVEYPVDPTDGHVRSCKALANLCASRVVDTVVLSLGGNDLYLDPKLQRDLALSLLPWRWSDRLRVANELAARYRHVVAEIRKVVPLTTQIVPVLPYHPHRQFSLVFGAARGCVASVARAAQWMLLSRLVTPLVQALLRVAVEEKLTVIDLSHTFDPTNVEHYGTPAISAGVARSRATPRPSSSRCSYEKWRSTPKMSVAFRIWCAARWTRSH